MNSVPESDRSPLLGQISAVSHEREDFYNLQTLTVHAELDFKTGKRKAVNPVGIVLIRGPRVLGCLLYTSLSAALYDTDMPI